MNIEDYNCKAWKHEVENKEVHTIPISREDFQKARNGLIQIPFTPTKSIPLEWIGDIKGKKVLCLAAAGGQQAPLFALMGAEVTVFDLCKEQLEQDEYVAEREGLVIHTVQGEMTDLNCFEDSSFDLIFNAVSNCFIEDIKPLWRECYRVLRSGGTLITGFINPVNYLFDMDELYDHNNLVVKYAIPYSDLKHLSKDRLDKYMENNEPLEFGHSLEDQIGGQIEAGFSIHGFFEDNNGGTDPLDMYIPTYIATRALK